MSIEVAPKWILKVDFQYHDDILLNLKLNIPKLQLFLILHTAELAPIMITLLCKTILLSRVETPSNLLDSEHHNQSHDFPKQT